jgi:ABC-type branched-subunit amino acid transport system substrate-binding protein
MISMLRLTRYIVYFSVLFFICCFSVQAEPSLCKVRIGAMLPLTGPASLIGERAYQAATLAREELPDELKSRIEILYEDTQMQPAAGLNAARRLISDPTMVALTGFGSETVSAISTSVEKSEIPGIFVTPDYRPIQGTRFLFRHWVDGKDMLPVLIPELRKRNINSVALVYSENPAMSGFGSLAESELPNQGFKLSYHYSVLPTETDFRTIASSIRKNKPDGVLFFFLPPQPSMFMKQFRLSNPHTPVFSFVNTENSHEVKAAAGALEGVIYPGPVFTEAFISKFENRFGEFPEFASGNIYDIVKMYALAVQSNACTRSQFRDFIASITNFEGALGHYGITNGNDFRFPVKLKQIKNGRFVELGH